MVTDYDGKFIMYCNISLANSIEEFWFLNLSVSSVYAECLDGLVSNMKNDIPAPFLCFIQK